MSRRMGNQRGEIMTEREKHLLKEQEKRDKKSKRYRYEY